MFEHGLLDGDKSDQLLRLLSSPAAAKKALEDMKAEVKKLTALRKEIAKGKTVNAHCKDIEEKMSRMEKHLDLEYNTLDEAKKEFEEYADSVRDNHAATAKRLKEQEEKVALELKEAKAMKTAAESLASESIAARRRAEEAHAAAEKVKKEYEAKVEDIKKRLKGL